MYSNLKNVQLLLAALKAYNVDTVVVSPGNSHNAIVRSLEEDKYFKTYNIVDERSAAFFAIGLCQELKKTIAICCTSGTAASNYLSGMTEAYRRKLPIIAITGDKNPYYLAQYEDQMIENMSIFDKVTKYACKLPIISNANDEWYCQRILNETLLELDHHGTGPVHIDIPIEQGMLAIGDSFTTKELPYFKKIERLDVYKNEQKVFRDVFSGLKDKKTLIICGQDDHITQTEIELIKIISKKYNCVFAADKLSNIHGSGIIEISLAAKAYMNKARELMPDVLISIAGNTALDYKFQLKNHSHDFEHWIVNREGVIADPFKNLSVVFEADTISFLEIMSQYGSECSNDYYDQWNNASKQVVLPSFEYSNMYTVQKLMDHIPAYSNLNIANSTTIRIAEYFALDESVQVYCNRGVNGIDGCASTFIGQAAASPDKLNFLIIGDLTFFYDMNSIWNRYVGKNVRIMLNNNQGAALFHFNQGLSNYPSLNENVAAEHFAAAKQWVTSQGFKYLSAETCEEFDEKLTEFIDSESDMPVFFEVFTYKDIDAKIQHDFYDEIVLKDKSDTAKKTAKKILKTVLGDEAINRIRRK